MAYDKINFVDREVSRPKTYTMTTNSDNSVTLTDSFGTVVTLGTPLNAENMNHIEDGIANSATLDLDNLSNAGEVKVGRMEALPKASSEFEGTIIQYTGETSGTLIKGYFYKCTKSGTSYTWESIEVQETPTVDTLDYTIVTLSPSTTNFVEGTTYSVAQSIQRTANLFAGYKSNYIDNINAKIPTQASSTNQLADKDYVTSSIASSAASFRGNWATWAAVPTDSSKYPEDASGSTTPTNNNYLVVQDATGYGTTYTGSWRFSYTGDWNTVGKNGWKPTYRIGSAFTSAQQASLDSGATSTLIAQISTNASDIGDLKTDKLDKVYTSGNKVYGTSKDGAQVTYTAGTNINMNEVSSGSSKTYNISAIDTKVTQTVSTTNGDYPVLAKASTAVTTTTDTSIFTSKVKVNPSTGNVTATNFTGALVGNASTATKATQDSAGNQINTNYQPIKYSRYAVSTYASSNPYIKLATFTISNVTNYDFSNLFWVESLGASTSKSYALVRLSARWGGTSYQGTKFEILEKYGDSTSIFDSLVFAYSYTTASSKGSLTGEIWMKTTTTWYFTYYLRPTQCNEYGDYSQTTVTMASNPWTYYNKSGTSASIASTAITSGYTQVAVTDKSSSGTAAKAVADANGNVITSTYATKTEVTSTLETIYPVGSIYLTVNSMCPLASLFGTWQLVSSGRALWTGTGSNGGSTIEAGLPNHQHTVANGGSTDDDSNSANYAWLATIRDRNTGTKYTSWASASNSIYGNSNTVQPPAYVVNAFRRTA